MTRDSRVSTIWQPALGGTRSIDLTNRAIELFGDRHVPDGMLGSVLPRVAQRFRRDLFAADLAVHQVVILRVARFADDVVDAGDEARIANQR